MAAVSSTSPPFTRRSTLFSTINVLFAGLMLFTVLLTILNVGVIHLESSYTAAAASSKSNTDDSSRIGSRVATWTRQGRQLVAVERQTKQQQLPEVSSRRKSRALVGIFSRDDAAGARQRQQYRTLLEDVWHDDPRTCSLPQFLERVSSSLATNECLLIYTFVVGAHSTDDESMPSEIVQDTTDSGETLALLVDKIVNPYSQDVNLPDVTRLNIRENDHNGKSQTFLYYAHRDIMGLGGNLENPRIEYCIKLNHDTFLLVDKYLAFAETDLAPAPFHRGILAGALKDKAYDNNNNNNDPAEANNQGGADSNSKPDAAAAMESPAAEDLPRLESFWGNEFEGIHLYMSGQLYILSYDLIDFVLSEVAFSKTRIAPGGYVIGREDHDISSMAFHSPTPLQVITIGTTQRFWKHPWKQDEQWELLLNEERKRKAIE